METPKQCFNDVVPEQRHYGFAVVNFEQISHIVLLFPLLTVNE